MSVSTSPTTIPLHVGAVLDRAPGPKYVAALAFAELAFRQPLPKPKVLAQMKRQVPEGFAFALRAPRESVVSKQGALRVTAEVEAGLAWLLAAADACSAKVVVIPTPADFTPGARSREVLREFVGRLPRPEGRHYVWLPSGLWEPHETEVIAAELGIVCGFDPLESRRPAGPVAYGTLRAMGHRTSFSPAAMGDALETLLTAETREAFVSVDAERGFDVARRLRQLATSVFAEAAAASGDEDDDSGDDEDADESGDDEDAEIDDEDEYAASGEDSDEDESGEDEAGEYASGEADDLDESEDVESDEDDDDVNDESDDDDDDAGEDDDDLDDASDDDDDDDVNDESDDDDDDAGEDDDDLDDASDDDDDEPDDEKPSKQSQQREQSQGRQSQQGKLNQGKHGQQGKLNQGKHSQGKHGQQGKLNQGKHSQGKHSQGKHGQQGKLNQGKHSQGKHGQQGKLSQGKQSQRGKLGKRSKQGKQGRP